VHPSSDLEQAASLEDPVKHLCGGTGLAGGGSRKSLLVGQDCEDAVGLWDENEAKKVQEWKARCCYLQNPTLKGGAVVRRGLWLSGILTPGLSRKTLFTHVSVELFVLHVNCPYFKFLISLFKNICFYFDRCFCLR